MHDKEEDRTYADADTITGGTSGATGKVYRRISSQKYVITDIKLGKSSFTGTETFTSGSKNCTVSNQFIP